MKNRIVNTALLKLYSSYNKYLRKGGWDCFHTVLGDKLYFRIKSYLEVRGVANRYPIRNPHSSLKSVVLIFDGNVYNAGLADKLRSMTSVYYWCKKNNIEFRILFTYPFVLSDYLLPNSYAWVIRLDEINYSKASPKALISYNNLFGAEKNTELHRSYLDSFLATGYEQIHLYTNTYCYDSHFSECYNELFKPKGELEKELEVFHKQIGCDYISISFRFTQLLGDLKDSFGTPLSDKDKRILIDKCIDSIKPIIEDCGVRKALVTSDSETFLDEIEGLPFIYIIPGAVGHIMNDVTDEQIRKAFWDMLMISHAKKAFMVRTPIMYRSGFAMRSAMIGNVPFEELVIE